MKTIVLKSDNDQFRVELKVDLFDNSTTFTIMEITGRVDDEVKAGLDLKLTNTHITSLSLVDQKAAEIGNLISNDLESITVYATDNNLLATVVDIDPAVADVVLTNTTTALDILTTGSMADGNDTVPYHQQILTEGGAGAAPQLTFEVTSGALPSGLILDPVSGWISGTPDTVENPTFEITVTDAFGETDVEAGIDIDIQA